MTTQTLYHDTIMALARSGAGANRLEKPDRTVTLDNPLCGDRITLDISIADNKITAIGHKVRGCVLCEAAAAVLASNAMGATPAELAEVHARLKATLQTGPDTQMPPPSHWQQLDAFAPVHGHKSRYECVLLPFKAALNATKKTP